MSLIITSNKLSGRFDSNNTGINNPAKYTNYLDNPITIKKNSQIAVQSVKLNKSGSILVPHGLKFGVYFGVELTAATNPEHISSILVPHTILDENEADQELSLTQLRKRLQERINQCLIHPDVYNRMTVTLNEDTTTKDFIGFNYKFDQAINASSINVKPSNWSTTGAPTANISFNASGDLIETTAGTSGFNTIYSLDHPVSLCEGVVEFTSLPTGTNYILGLRRGHYGAKLRGENLEYGSQDIKFLQNVEAQRDGVAYDLDFKQSGAIQPYDILVSVQTGGTYPDNSDLGAGKRVFIKYLTYDTQKDQDGNYIGQYRYQNVIYWGYDTTATGLTDNASTAPINITNASKGGNPYDRFKFVTRNEMVEVHIGNASGYDQLVFHESDFNTAVYTPKKYNLMKPLDDTCRMLYPQVYMHGATGSGKSITLNHYSGRLFPNINYNTIPDLNRLLLNENREKDVIEMLMNYFKVANFGDVADITRPVKELGAHNAMQDYEFVLILEPDPIYSLISAIGDYTATEDFNCAELFGYNNGTAVVRPPYNASTTNGSQLNYTYTSPKLPTFKSLSSAFIRINNLNPVTFNTSKSRRSKILYHLPRFDNSNNEVGDGLYYEATEKTYIDLNNPNDFNINELNIELIDVEERTVEDLNGRTIIIFHIREKLSHK